MPARQKKDDDHAIGRSKGGLSTKIHALVDALGNPLRRLECDGAEIVTTEMVLFEWLRTADDPRLRRVIDLIRSHPVLTTEAHGMIVVVNCQPDEPNRGDTHAAL